MLDRAARLTLAAVAATLTGCASPPRADVASVAASVPACTAATLRISRLGGDAGMGHRTLAFAFVNTGAASCRLTGFASVQPLDAAGDNVTTVPVTTASGGYLSAPQPARTLRLAPGARVWFEIGYSVIPRDSATCPDVAAVRVAAPGTRHGRRFTQPMQPCDGIQVLPLRDGPPPYPSDPQPRP